MIEIKFDHSDFCAVVEKGMDSQVVSNYALMLNRRVEGVRANSDGSFVVLYGDLPAVEDE